MFLLSYRFKDGTEINEYVSKVLNKVETTCNNHSKSRHHTSSDEQLQKIRFFLCPKGKISDLAFFHSCLMLVEKIFWFVSCRLGEGAIASTRIGTTGDRQKKK